MFHPNLLLEWRIIKMLVHTYTYTAEQVWKYHAQLNIMKRMLCTQLFMVVLYAVHDDKHMPNSAIWEPLNLHQQLYYGPRVDH